VPRSGPGGGKGSGSALIYDVGAMDRSERRVLIVIVAFFGVAYALYGLFRHRHFGSSAFDLGIFDQVVWHLSRFEPPASSIRGFTNFLGDHFFPVIALFAPLYWLRPGPETLIVAQAALFAASIVPVFLFIRTRLPASPAFGMTIAYGCFWGIQRAAAFDVHEAAFAPLAIATAILAIDRCRWTLFWLSAAAMLLIKEDHIPLLAAFGVYLAIRGERRQGVTAFVSSMVAFFVLIGVIIPAFNDAGAYGYTSAYASVLARPWLLPVSLVTPAVKVETAILWFAPFAFFSLASPLAILVVPFALTRFLSESPNHWGTVFHYSAPLAPILAMSAADGLERIARRLKEDRARRLMTGAAAASVLLSAVLPGRQPLWRIFAPAHYASTDSAAVGRALVQMIPEGASVVAQAAVVPHLSLRDRIYVLDSRAPDADYVLASDSLSPWPAADFNELRLLLEDRQARGYVVMIERGGWTILRSP
jgi:uncharacterized membrane protein